MLYCNDGVDLIVEFSGRGFRQEGYEFDFS